MLITPNTRVGELLDAYPQLENVLFELSPSFSKLKNPILRKTVARVATLQQAAIVGGLKVDELVNRLRKEVGQEKMDYENSAGPVTSAPPQWFDHSKIKVRFDATSIINSGGSPMAEILTNAQKLKPGEVLELKTPFVPAPILNILKEKGFQLYLVQKENEVLSYLKQP